MDALIKEVVENESPPDAPLPPPEEDQQGDGDSDELILLPSQREGQWVSSWQTFFMKQWGIKQASCLTFKDMMADLQNLCGSKRLCWETQNLVQNYLKYFLQTVMCPW